MRGKIALSVIEETSEHVIVQADPELASYGKAFSRLQSYERDVFP